MPFRPRPIAIAAVSGLAAAAIAIVGVAALANDEPKYDGEFVLDEPGVFQEPLSEVNDDLSGLTLPDIDLTDINGEPRSLREYAGKPLVINVWFSNCAPCRRELRDFAVVHEEVGDKIQFVGIDPFDTVEAMQRFASERGVTYDLLRDIEREFSNEIGIVAYPVTLFVSAEGEVLRQTGEIDADGLRAAIRELF